MGATNYTKFYYTKHWADFRFTGCDWKLDDDQVPKVLSPLHIAPSGTIPFYNGFISFGNSNEMHLQTFSQYPWHDEDVREFRIDKPTLGNTQTKFNLLYPHNVRQFDSDLQISFFQDDYRTFMISPEETPLRIDDADVIGPEIIDKTSVQYFRSGQQASRIGMAHTNRRVNPLDPSLFKESYPFAFNGSAQPTSSRATVSNGNLSPGTNMKTKYMPVEWSIKGYRFRTYYHPYVCNFIGILRKHGIDGLMQRSNQIELGDDDYFEPTYQPKKYDLVMNSKFYPIDDVDFTYGGSYSIYNWELFFYAPLLIALRLSRNQRFEEAQEWFHYIFDPTDSSALPVPQRYWRTRPFYETQKEDYEKQQIQKLLELIAAGSNDQDLVNQVREWRSHPFNPHVIALLRTTAYQKTVVMKYLDNLIAWGDQLFRRDTMESINEATQIYILVAQILGQRPKILPRKVEPRVQTYNTLEPKLIEDDFSNPIVQLENLVPSPGSQVVDSSQNNPQLPSVLYFCVPKNDKLLSYWDMVEDRLFKIRHCMNIEGIVRQLPLFEPPIDPGFLVRAAAAGIDISTALNDMNAPLPHYRFRIMLQKALELCSEVKTLGSALLSAIEKRDTEALVLLRSGQEIGLLKKMRDVKLKQIDEAKETLEGLKKSKKVIEHRRDYYHNIAKESQSESYSANEREHMDNLDTAHIYSMTAQGIQAGIAAAHMFPNFDVGTAGWASTAVVKASFGGNNLGSALQAAAGVIQMISAQYSHDAAMASIKGGYERRWDEWKHQESLSIKEMSQIDKQIDAADLRKQISEKDIENHDVQIDNAKSVDDQMHDKFTNQELYDWMVGQISTVYFQSYQLAYDVAKRAERAYRFELGLTDSNFIQFGYWDSLKKGLLSGEILHLDLKRMEMDYLEQNKREYEITKHFSLKLLNPIALIQLKEKGACYLKLDESVFDLDNSGQYMRRVKSVSLSIPCVSGPYTSVNCRLTLVKNSLRKNTSISPQYKRSPEEDTRFMDNIVAIQSIVTSNAQNDNGLFELNFNDERYIPFEGAGAISEWHLELDRDANQFDFNTISDVIVHIRYTSREGGEQLKNEAKRNITELLSISPSVHLFSIAHEFPNEWHRFLHNIVLADPITNKKDRHVLKVPVKQDRFPFVYRDKILHISKLELMLLIKDSHIYSESTSQDEIPYENGEKIKLHIYSPPVQVGGQPQEIKTGFNLDRNPKFDGLPYAQVDLNQPKIKVDKENYIWTVEVFNDELSNVIKELVLPKDEGDNSHTQLDPNAIEDLIIAYHFQSASNE